MLWTLREMTADYASKYVGLVVEGRGDANVAPVLLRKYLTEQGLSRYSWQTGDVQRS